MSSPKIGRDWDGKLFLLKPTKIVFFTKITSLHKIPTKREEGVSVKPDASCWGKISRKGLPSSSYLHLYLSHEPSCILVGIPGNNKNNDN